MFCRDCCAVTLSFLFYTQLLLLVPYLLLYHTASNIIKFSRRSHHNSSNIRCDEHGASLLLSASLRDQSKATQASKHRPAAASASGGVIPVTSRLLSLSLALGKEASNSQSALLDKTTASPHNNHRPKHTTRPPTYSASNTTPLAATAASSLPCAHTKHCSTITHTRPCKNGRRRARYAVLLSTTYR